MLNFLHRTRENTWKRSKIRILIMDHGSGNPTWRQQSDKVWWYREILLGRSGLVVMVLRPRNHAWTQSHHLMKALLEAMLLYKHQLLYDTYSMYTFSKRVWCAIKTIQRMSPKWCTFSPDDLNTNLVLFIELKKNNKSKIFIQRRSIRNPIVLNHSGEMVMAWGASYSPLAFLWVSITSLVISFHWYTFLVERIEISLPRRTKINSQN